MCCPTNEEAVAKGLSGAQMFGFLLGRGQRNYGRDHFHRQFKALSEEGRMSQYAQRRGISVADEEPEDESARALYRASRRGGLSARPSSSGTLCGATRPRISTWCCSSPKVATVNTKTSCPRWNCLPRKCCRSSRSATRSTVNGGHSSLRAFPTRSTLPFNGSFDRRNPLFLHAQEARMAK